MKLLGDAGGCIELTTETDDQGNTIAVINLNAAKINLGGNVNLQNVTGILNLSTDQICLRAPDDGSPLGIMQSFPNEDDPTKYETQLVWQKTSAGGYAFFMSTFGTPCRAVFGVGLQNGADHTSKLFECVDAQRRTLASIDAAGHVHGTP